MPHFVLRYAKDHDQDWIAACAHVIGQLPKAQMTRLPAKARHPSHWDATLTLKRGHDTADFGVQAKTQLAATALPHRLAALKKQAQQEGIQPCLLARYINPNIAATLRKEGIAYADAAGNLFFCTPFFYALREGARSLPQIEPETRVFHTPAGLRLLGLLLVKPEAANWPYRMLAQATGTAVGTVHDLLGQLRQDGFLQLTDREHRTLRQRDTLLERFLLGYRQRLRPKLLRGRYRAAPLQGLTNILMPADRGVLLGGELAAAQITGLLQPERATLHVPAVMDLPRLAKDLRLLPDARGNVDVLALPGASAHWTRPGTATPPLAAALLTYAELLVTDDDRLREIAARLYETEIASHVHAA